MKQETKSRSQESGASELPMARSRKEELGKRLKTILFLLLSTFLLFAFRGEARAGSLIYGDAEPDADVDVTDILTIRQNAAGFPGVPLLGNADASGHECELAVVDALAIRQYLLGFRPDLPVFIPPACWAIGLTATNGDGQVGSPNQTLPQPLEVTLNNIPACTQTVSGCTRGGVTITYDITSDGTGGATLPGSVTTLDIDTDSSGIVSTLLTMGSGPGTVIVAASIDLYSAEGGPLTTVSAAFTAVAVGCGIISIGPTTGCPGDAVTIDGSNFGGAAGSVSFDATPATVISWGDTSIAVYAPGGDYSNVTVTPVATNECNLTGTYSYDNQEPTVDVAPMLACYPVTSVTVSATCGDVGSGVYTCSVSIDGGGNWYPSPYVFNGLSDGYYTAIGLVVDGCSNFSLDLVGETFEVDTWASLTITYPTNGQDIPLGDSLVSGFAATDITTVTVTSDQGHSESSGVDGGGNWSVVLSGVSAPSIFITARGTDNCGNPASDSVTANVVPPSCSISNVSPTIGCSGNPVTITGISFGAISGSVSFNSVSATITFWTDAVIIVDAPGGDYTIVTVTSNTGGICTLAGNYSYDNVPPPAPTITSPTNGAIIGTNWVPTTITCTEGTCKERLDWGPWQGCSFGFFTFDGPHTLDAMCIDNCNNSSTATSNFWVDTMGPWVTFTNPGNGQTNVPTGVNIEIEFNEDMDKGSVESGFTLSTGTMAPLPGNFYWRSDDTVVFATPDLLTDYTNYTVDLAGATDLVGNPLGPLSLYFTTGDCTPPQVLSKNPSGDNLVDSSILTQITVIFNESMNDTNGRMEIRNMFDMTVVDADIWGGSYGGTLTWTTTSISNDTLTLDLDSPSPIQEGAGYRIDVWSLGDQNNNWLPGDIRWGFVTDGPSSDIAPPQLIVSLPFDGQVSVPRKLYDFIENAIMLGFNEGLDPSTVNQTNITLTNSGGPVSFDMDWGVADGPSPFSIMLMPDLPLNPLETYTIGISGGIEDSAGNNFIPQSISFTTANEPDDITPPQVEATLPGDGWIDLSRWGTNGKIGFTEAIDCSTVNFSAITLKETDTGIPVKGLRLEEDGDLTAWYLDFWSTGASPEMKPNTRHTLTISSGSIKDISGNPLAEYSWTFTTVPAGPGTGPPANQLPRIWDLWPDTNATSFENGNVTVEFEIGVWDDDGDPLTVWVEDEHGNSWTLSAPTFSSEYSYETFIPGDFDSGNETDITYDGWETFTYYVTDGQPGHTISVSNQAYVWPTVDLLNQVSPLNGEVITSGGPTTLVWQNVDTTNAVMLLGQYMNFNTGEQGMFFNLAEFNQTILPGLSPGLYLWMVMQMPSVHGDVFESGGIGTGYQGMGVSNFNVVDPNLPSISGTVSYAGSSVGPVFVMGHTDAFFSGGPVGVTIIPGPGDYTIYNLPYYPYIYYAQSFMDVNENMTYDTGMEPYGMYDVLPAIGEPDPIVILSATNMPGIDITISDP